MAFLLKYYTTLPKQGDGNAVIPMIDASIGMRRGKMGANRRDDVMLIQWLLVEALARSTRLGGPSGAYVGPSLSLDGDYGASTDYHWCRFLLNYVDQYDVKVPSTGINTLMDPNQFDENGLLNKEWLAALLSFADVFGIELAEMEKRRKTMPLYLQQVLGKNVWLAKNGAKLRPFPL